MSWWTVSTVVKKSAEEHLYYYKDGITIKVIQGYRWGKVCVLTDDDFPPDIDKENEDGFEVTNSSLIADWELEEFMDGWYGNIEFPEDVDPIEQERLTDIFSDNGIMGLEEDGWEDTCETEWWLFGPLEITRAD